ncbi:HesB/YadR/YfhF family protein [Bacillus dakarensis]|uniref:HesB/YadR/YfhF family protein n=1 Tax=Robertmurraya dakarensis TaxID=1926278 RepID=UPI000981374E|nr:HesB/YadR/YfhF family protein [Bacillus dakarensis]
MNIHISDNAIEWFKDEMDLEAGDKIKFFSKIYGTSPVQEGFSLGFTKDPDPINVVVSTEVEGILFFIEEGDLWFFDEHDLYVEYNKSSDELEFDYKKP